MSIAWHKKGGFSLIEVLVGVAVLVLLTLILLAITNSASSVTGSLQRRMDAESQARLVMDRLAMDFGQAVKRPDVDLRLDRRTGDDELSFYAQASGYKDSIPANVAPRPLSIIAYRMGTNQTLERASRALSWSEMTFSSTDEQALTSANATNTLPPINQPGTSIFETFGDQVLRLEYAFLLRSDPGATPPRLTPTFSATAPAALSDIAAIIVACATLDSSARSSLTSAQITSIAEALPDYQTADAAANRDILAIWNERLRDPSAFTPAGVPIALAKRVRVYQRYYPLK